jgi:hypothetical protein
MAGTFQASLEVGNFGLLGLATPRELPKMAIIIFERNRRPGGKEEGMIEERWYPKKSRAEGRSRRK